MMKLLSFCFILAAIGKGTVDACALMEVGHVSAFR